MNYNLLSYLLFLPSMLVLSVLVARTAHRNGAVWLMGIFDDARFVAAVNNILMAGCHVLNAGYVALVITRWERVTGLPHMLAELAGHFALIVSTLAVLHYINISVLLIWSRMHRERHGRAPHASTPNQAPATNT
jgi:hypothetical protein